jgi:hypothetical protein
LKSASPPFVHRFQDIQDEASGYQQLREVTDSDPDTNRMTAILNACHRIDVLLGSFEEWRDHRFVKGLRSETASSDVPGCK